jgi:tetratricopeptide (TPR) repeat protein
VFSGDRREQHVLDMLERADRDRLRPDGLSAALRGYVKAVKTIRGLVDRHPDDPRHRQMLASTLYTLGALRTQAGEPSAAIAALDECEEVYRATAGQTPSVRDVRPLIADVQARRAVALAADGRGASAVPEADSAVRTYEALAERRGDLHDRNLARVLALAAGVLRAHGDPDLAVAAADRAVRLFIAHRTGPAQFAITAAERPYLLAATATAATIHAQHGRAEVAFAAASLGLQFTGDDAAHREVQRAHRGLDVMRHHARPAVGRRVTAALRGETDSGAGPDGEIVSGLLQGLAALAPFPAQLGLPAARPDVTDQLAVTTLAWALVDAGEGPLAAKLTRPALAVALCVPSHRCDPEVAPVHATRLADLATAALDRGAVAGGIRLGLESHALFAAASRAQVPAMRHQLRDFSPPWARVLLAMCDTFEVRRELRPALDLAAWAGGLAVQLVPVAVVDPLVGELASRAVNRHADLLAATGDRAGAEAARATVRDLTPPPTP